MDLNLLINEAAQNKDWVILVGALIALVVPVVLKLFGKSVPIVDTILDFGIRTLVSMRKKPAEVAPAKDEKVGLAAIVQIEDARKDKDESPKP